MPATMIDECRHGLDTRTCSMCRSAAGYIPGTDRQRKDCTVQTVANLTGATYEEALELMARHGRRDGKGASVTAVHDALLSAGWVARPTTLSLDEAVRSGRSFHVSANRNGKGHSWAVVAGQQLNEWRGGFRYRIWEVS